MVSIAVSKMSMTELIFVNPGTKVNGQYYRNVLLSRQMLPGDTFVFQQDSAPSRRAKDTIKLLQQEMPDFIGLISGHQAAQTMEVWGVVQQRVYECHMNSVDELKQCLVEVWNSLQQNIVDTAINKWRKQLRACVHADGRHFEHLL